MQHQTLKMRKYKISDGKPKVKRQLERHRHRHDNINIDLKEDKGADWTHLAQDMEHWQALVSMGMYLRVPLQV